MLGRKAVKRTESMSGTLCAALSMLSKVSIYSRYQTDLNWQLPFFPVWAASKSGSICRPSATQSLVQAADDNCANKRLGMQTCRKLSFPKVRALLQYGLQLRLPSPSI